MPESFDDVSVQAAANIYFDGKVVSHSVFFGNGSKKTLGIIFPGKYKFDTDAPELMEIISGTAKVTLNGTDWKDYSAGSSFRVSGKSSFTISCENGITQYICSFG